LGDGLVLMLLTVELLLIKLLLLNLWTHERIVIRQTAAKSSASIVLKQVEIGTDSGRAG
jgi:hypothetical protein